MDCLQACCDPWRLGELPRPSVFPARGFFSSFMLLPSADGNLTGVLSPFFHSITAEAFTSVTKPRHFYKNRNKKWGSVVLTCRNRFFQNSVWDSSVNLSELFRAVQNKNGFQERQYSHCGYVNRKKVILLKKYSNIC